MAVLLNAFGLILSEGVPRGSLGVECIRRSEGERLGEKQLWHKAVPTLNYCGSWECC